MGLVVCGLRKSVSPAKGVVSVMGKDPVTNVPRLWRARGHSRNSGDAVMEADLNDMRFAATDAPFAGGVRVAG